PRCVEKPRWFTSNTGKVCVGSIANRSGAANAGAARTDASAATAKLFFMNCSSRSLGMRCQDEPETNRHFVGDHGGIRPRALADTEAGALEGNTAFENGVGAVLLVLEGHHHI